MMKKSIKQLLCLAVAGCLSASASFAVTYSFAPLSDLTAGGTPGKNVAISTADHVTLGLAAQQRYSNPALTDNGAGTYYATTGSNFGGSAFEGATWNFDFYIKGDVMAQNYTYSLSYGLAGGTVYSFNPLNDIDALGAYVATGAVQDSQNLMFATFGGAANGFASTFDPNADATYDFLLTAKSGDDIVAQSGIRVIVGAGSSVPDSGSTMALLGVAITGIGVFKRKFLA